MGRFLAFAGTSFYANGGWMDYRGFASTLDEAVAIAKGASDPSDWEFDWWHVVDAETGKIVLGKRGSYCGNLPDDVEEAP